MEIFEDIKGYEGIYSISNLGKVKNNINNKYLKIGLCDKGYKRFNLYKKGKLKTFYLHRLLAIHFIDNPNNYQVINHIDGNKLNNSLNNLEWCTHKHNTQHAFKLGLIKGLKGSKHGRAILNEEQVKLIKEHKISLTYAIKMFKISKTQFYRVKNNISWVN